MFSKSVGDIVGETVTRDGNDRVVVQEISLVISLCVVMGLSQGISSCVLWRNEQIESRMRCVVENGRHDISKECRIPDGRAGWIALFREKYELGAAPSAG